MVEANFIIMDLVGGVTEMEELVRLGRSCGFSVQAFEVVKDGHTQRISPVSALTTEHKRAARERIL
jgi:hypothetical protein